MSSVEDRVVAMKFDNKQFEPAAKTTLSTLDRLKAALGFKGAGKGLADLQGQANKFSLGGLANAASQVGSKFSAASVVAIAALANIASRAVDVGLRVAKAFTIEPLKQGFQEYETNLNAVQTILANTQASGATLKDVNATLAELNTYSDKTIYNFSEMAKNIGTFTAAGVDLKTAAGSIKGIANLAALSGSNSQQASTAMYQLSQAISSGRVSLQDWNSVVNAGMGGTVFQRALAENAQRIGTLSKGAVELKGKMKNVSIEGKSFRESITAKPGEQSWLTSEVLTDTLKQFSNDLSVAQLKAMGFSQAQAEAIKMQAQTAEDAATKVKTFTQLIGTLQESAGSGWANTFQIILGDFEEAKALFTSVNNVVGGMISNSAKARNKMLQDWKTLGGRTAVLKGIENIFNAFVQIAKPIHEAFREIFPATTGKQLADLSKQFLEFTKGLKAGSETINNIKRTAKGFFALLSIGVSIVKAVFGVIGRLFGVVSKGSGGFLAATANVGDFLVKLDQTIKKGDLINKFFNKIGQVLAVPIAVIRAFGIAMIEMVKGFKENGFASIGDVFDRIGARLKPLAGASDLVSAAWSKMFGFFKKVGSIVGPMVTAISGALSGIGDAIGKAFKAGDFNSVYDAINTGLLAGIVLVIKKFFDEGLKIDFGGGFVEGIKDTFGALTDTLSAMQSQIQSKTLMNIAIAVALLTASIVALSLIDSGKLTKALTAMGVAFGQLLLAMSILTKISGTAGFLKVPVIAGAMILLAGAVLVLTAAVRSLSGLSWEELAKGLLGVAAVLAMLVATSSALGKSSTLMVRTGLAMIPLALGVLILSKAVQSFANMSWEQMGKGLVGLAGSLLIIAGAVALMPPTMIAQAAGLLILSVALMGIGKALDNMGGMKWSEIAKAMVVLAGSLLILAGGLFLMTEALPGAAALVVAALALAVLAPVLKVMASMSWEEIGKGMVTLAGSLLILAGGLLLMTATTTGSAALLIAASALAVLAPVLILLGSMSWEAIAKGMVAIAASFAVLGLSSLILAPLVPMIIALSAALLLLGAAFTLIGVGALAIATAFSIFTAAGTAGVAVLLAMINLIPQFMTKFAEGIIGFATTIAAQADKFVGAFASLLNSLVDAIIQITPKIGQLINVLLRTILTIIINNAPLIAAAGIRLMVAFLVAIRGKIGQITQLAGDIIVKFLASMGRQVPRIAKTGTDLIIKLMQAVQAQQGRLLEAGARMIISFINNLASTISSHSGELRSAGINLALAIVDGITGGLASYAYRAAQAAASMAASALAAAKNALGIHSPSREFKKLGVFSVRGFVGGFKESGGIVSDAASGMAKTAVNSVAKTISTLPSLIGKRIDFNPVIKPHVDLREVNQSAVQIQKLFKKKPKPIWGLSALGPAQAISEQEKVRRDSATGRGLTATGGTVIFDYKQTINSPTPLTPIKVYRNTRSLIGQAKSAIGGVS